MYRIAACLSLIVACPVQAATPREVLTRAVFQTTDKATAIALIGQARTGSDAILAKAPGNREAQVVRAMATGYEAKLLRSRSDALAARRAFEALAASDPRDPEAAAAVGGWHLDVIVGVGAMAGRMLVGASKATGLTALDRAVALGGDRAFFSGLAGMLRLQLDARDARARALIETAAHGTTPTPLDVQLQRSAVLVAARLRANDLAGAQKLAKILLPLGRVGG